MHFRTMLNRIGRNVAGPWAGRWADRHQNPFATWVCNSDHNQDRSGIYHNSADLGRTKYTLFVRPSTDGQSGVMKSTNFLYFFQQLMQRPHDFPFRFIQKPALRSKEFALPRWPITKTPRTNVAFCGNACVSPGGRG